MTAKKKSIKEQMIEDKINIPVIKEKEISIKPFIEKGHIFEKEVSTKWLINFNIIPELIIEQYRKYENWFNWYFNNPCICPFMFIGEKEYPVFISPLKDIEKHFNFQLYKFMRSNK